MPSNRISIPQILAHPWLKGAISGDELECEEDDEHDFEMGLSFSR